MGLLTAGLICAVLGDVTGVMRAAALKLVPTRCHSDYSGTSA